MTSKELRTKSTMELEQMLGETREKMRKLYFDLASGRIKNVKEVSTLRKEVARLHTILKEMKVQ